MARRKDIFWGKNNIRMSVSDRKSKAARPWNHPDVVTASQAYGVPFSSFKQVHTYENTIQDQGSLEDHERFTCRSCGILKSDPKHEEHN